MTFDAQPLRGRAALVAGASGGINLAVAEKLGALGARVAILSRDPDRIAAAAATLAAKGVETQGHAGDVRDSEAMQRIAAAVAAAWGPLDIVVSGAAGNFFAPAATLSANGFRTVIEIDLIGTFNVLSAAWPHLRKPGAAIVNISAPQAQRAMRLQAHACSAKAGVDMLTRCLALEWGCDGVRVNAVSPGPIADTEGLARLATDEALGGRIRDSLALPRFGARSDIAEAVAWLCSDAAGFVTGTTLDCDGGMRLGNFHTPS
ncbi:MAG TPA: SDR family oxidoreductase [Caulobacteraceae bacterium]|jgi:hypothetical protein